MTTAELIEKLGTLPPDAIVKMNTNGDDGNLVVEDVNWAEFSDGVVTLSAWYSN